jgi:hypothetical protein
MSEHGTPKRRPTPALVVACIALFVALGGTSIAAADLVIPRNSVGTRQLKKSAVTSIKVKDGALVLTDFAAAERTKLVGPKGDKGDKGDAGPQGGPGLSGIEIVTKLSAFDSTASKNAFAQCPDNKKVIAGGGNVSSDGAGTPALQASLPLNNGWRAWGSEPVAYAPNWQVAAYAICANVG